MKVNDVGVNRKSKLNELFNQPYKYSWPHIDEYEAVAVFSTDDAGDVSVNFDYSEYNNTWEVGFSIDGEFRATGTGDQFRIFATVMEVMKEFGYRAEVARFAFHAEKNVASSSNSRARLYSRMVRKFASQNGYQFEEHSEGWRTTYVLTNNDINESAAGRITKQNTTVDVKPGETKRQAAKFGNKVNSKNQPPLLHRQARKNSDPHTLSNLGLAEAASGPVIGYKIMNYDPETNELISGADSRIRKQLSKGMTLQMSGRGIFMSTNPEYVQMYYGGHNDVEVMLTLQFNADEITSGNLTDKENEFTVPRAKVVDYRVINHLTEAAAEIKMPAPKDTLGVARADMPQVHIDHYPELIKYLASHGNKFTKKEVAASELKPVQSEFSDAGVRKMMRTGGRPDDSSGKDKKPLIVSADNYIIDGHHRWLAAYNLGDTVPVMRGTLPIKKMFQLVKDFRHTTYKDITESFALDPKRWNNSLKDLLAVIQAKMEEVDDASRHWYGPNDSQRDKLEKDYQALLAIEMVIQNHQKAIEMQTPNHHFLYSIDYNRKGYTGLHVAIDGEQAEIKWLGSYNNSRKASELMNNAKSFLKKAGVKKIKLTAKWGSEGFYEKLNFKRNSETRYDPFAGTTYTDMSKDITESTQLNELFNNVYDWKWGHRPDVALFTTEDGGEVVVAFSRLQKNSTNYEVSFSKNDNIKRTGEGDQFKIIATVIAVIKDFISNNPDIELLTFTAKREGRELENKKYKNARAALYRRLLARFAEQHGFEFHEAVVGRMTEFLLVKKEKQNEQYSMMEWACIEGGHDLNDLLPALSEVNIDNRNGRGAVNRARHLTPEIKYMLKHGAYQERTGSHVPGPLWENMSVTGSDLSKQDRTRDLQPGTDAWFEHWFSRPYLKRNEVVRLKEQAVKAIKEKKYEKANKRRKAKRN